MPLFFFDIQDGDDFIRDETGIDFDTAREARDSAVTGLSEIVRDRMPDGEIRDFVVTIRNERERAIYEARLALRGRWFDDGDD